MHPLANDDKLSWRCFVLLPDNYPRSVIRRVDGRALLYCHRLLKLFLRLLPPLGFQPGLGRLRKVPALQVDPVPRLINLLFLCLSHLPLLHRQGGADALVDTGARLWGTGHFWHRPGCDMVTWAPCDWDVVQ
jgi:hypothetical protein